MTKMTNHAMLIANSYISVIDNVHGKRLPGENTDAMLGTILANLAHHGFVPNVEAVKKLQKLGAAQLQFWWPEIEKAVKKVSGASRQMGKFVVYKNFPKECLAMSESEWVIKQILMYIGFPNAMFTEEEKARPMMLEAKTLKVLSLADSETPATIFESLKQNASRWSDNQDAWAKTLVSVDGVVDIDEFKFKENGIVLAAMLLGDPATFEVADIRIANATDVLRLCAAMSGGDVSLRENVKFRRFKRAERRLIVSMLEGTKNIADDFAMRPEAWKRLLSRLHPGDFNVPRVQAAYNTLYNRTVKPFSALVDPQQPTVAMLDTLASRPGEFVRRFHNAYKLFGLDAVTKFIDVIPNLSTSQLVKFRAYLESIGERTKLMYPPKGNWGRVQVVPNNKVPVADAEIIVKAIGRELKSRWKVAFPNGIKLDPATANIKLQSNDQKLAEYGRGTVFDIPENITFLRSASYWAMKRGSNIWFDNGWNFFDANWSHKGVVSWDNQHFNHYYGRERSEAAAIFSGDPTNSKDMKGRACQMADLYIDRLLAVGVRYAVWNVLCYSRVSFDEAEDVLATLQMGENAEKGNLYEPSRAQMVFPLKGKSFTKYVAYIDLARRKLVYMDADLRADVHSAARNGDTLQEKMPAYLEYLNSLPSVADLFKDANKGTLPVLYSDDGVTIRTKSAYVFQPRNPNNQYEKIALASHL
jgi:hypothetical protein